MRKEVATAVCGLSLSLATLVLATPVTTQTGPTISGVNEAVGFFDGFTTGSALPIILVCTLIGAGVGLAGTQDTRGARNAGIVGAGAGIVIGAAAPNVTRTMLTGFSAAPMDGFMLPVEPDLFLRNPVTIAIFLGVAFGLAAWRRRQARKMSA